MSKPDFKYPLSLQQDCANSLLVTDAAGNKMFEYTSENDEVTQVELDRMAKFVNVINLFSEDAQAFPLEGKDEN